MTERLRERARKPGDTTADEHRQSNQYSVVLGQRTREQALIQQSQSKVPGH